MALATLSGYRTLLRRNLQRGCNRLLLLAVLLFGAILFQVLYGTWLQSSLSQNLSTAESLSTPYFDIMIVLSPDTEPVPFASYPYVIRRNGSSTWPYLVFAEEKAVKVAVNSVAGDIELLSWNSFFTFSSELLQGDMPVANTEILLPMSYAERCELSLGQTITVVKRWMTTGLTTDIVLDFTIVGIYDDTGLLYRPAIATFEAASQFLEVSKPNCVLIQINSKERVNFSLEETIQYMRQVYPREQFISSHTPAEMSASLIQQRNSSSTGIMVLFRLFLFISLQTVVLLDFQRRRREFASLKCVGMSLPQVIAMYCVEHIVALLIGLSAVCATLLGLWGRLPWLQTLGLGTVMLSAIQAVLFSLLLMLATLLQPMLIVCIANINQLLFARNIPLRSLNLNHLNRPTHDDVLREHEENVRLLKIPSGSDADGLMIFKAVGDIVKQGETIAARESWFGVVMHEWCAWCDGTIIDMSDNGMIAIRPLLAETAFYSYSNQVQKSPIMTNNDPVQRQEKQKHEDKEGKQNILGGFIGKSRKFRFAILAVLVLGCGALYVFAPWQSGTTIEYITQSLAPTTLRNVVKATGNIKARATAEIANVVTGRVEEVHFADGDYVEQGQVLLGLANPTLNMNLRQAQYELNEAMLSYEQIRLAHGNEAGDVHLSRLKVEEIEAELESTRRSLSDLQIQATAAGRVTAVHVREGNSVSNNALIFSLYAFEEEDADEYQARLQQAKANLTLVENNLGKLNIYASYDGEVADIAISPGEVVNANDLLLGVRYPHWFEQNQAARLQLQQAQLQLEEVERNLQHLQVTAPITGYISEVSLLPGERVATSTSLAVISDDRQMLVCVNVPQSYINGVTVGNKAEVMITNSARTYQGLVTSVTRQGQLNPDNYLVTYPVEITIDNDGTLYAGMSATVNITSSDATFRAVSSLRGTLLNTSSKTIYPQVGGEIVELLAQNGDWVVQGQTIAILKSDALELAYAQALETLYNVEVEQIRAPFFASVERIAVQSGEKVSQGQLLLELSSDAVIADYNLAKRNYERLLAREESNAEIYSRVQGTVLSLHVSEGESIEAGQLLAELSQPELRLQEQRLKTELVLARNTLETLLQNPAVGELEAARLAVEQTSAKVAVCEEQVSNLEVRALISGVIYARRLPLKGEYMGETQVFADIYSRQLILEVSVDENDVAFVQEGANVEIEVDSLPGEIIKSNVLSIAWRGITSGGITMYPTTLLLEPNTGLRLGMSCDATIIVEEVEDALVVPHSALNLKIPDYSPSSIVGEGEAILYKSVNGEVEEMVVTLGMKTDNYIELRSGVSAGDTVVIGMRTQSKMPGIFSLGSSGSTSR